MKKNVLLTVLVSFLTILLSGCIPQQVWYKPGGTDDEFNTVKYKCLQDSQQRVSHAERQGFSAVSDSQVATNGTLFSACMNAKGWKLIRRSEMPQNPPKIETLRENTTQPRIAKKELPITPPEAKQGVEAETPQESIEKQQKLFTANSNANLREGPSAKTKRVGSLKKGDVVDVLAKKGEWYQIKISDGTTAWCTKSVLESK